MSKRLRLEQSDLENASTKMRKLEDVKTHFGIFDFSTKNTIHDLFIIESQEMTQRNRLRYVEFSIRPFRKPHVREIIFSCFFEGEKFKLASVEVMFDYHFEKLTRIMKSLPTSTFESSIFNIATELFHSKFEITMYSRDMHECDEVNKQLFNPYYNRVQYSLSTKFANVKYLEEKK